jgi:hypothetical protein
MGALASGEEWAAANSQQPVHAAAQGEVPCAAITKLVNLPGVGNHAVDRALRPVPT